MRRRGRSCLLKSRQGQACEAIRIEYQGASYFHNCANQPTSWRLLVTSQSGLLMLWSEPPKQSFEQRAWSSSCVRGAYNNRIHGLSSKPLRTFADVLGRIELEVGSASLAHFPIRHLHDASAEQHSAASLLALGMQRLPSPCCAILFRKPVFIYITGLDFAFWTLIPCHNTSTLLRFCRDVSSPWPPEHDNSSFKTPTMTRSLSRMYHRPLVAARHATLET